MHDTEFILHRRRITLCDDNLPEKVAAAPQRQKLLLPLLFRREPPCGLNINLSWRTIDNKVNFVLSQKLDPIIISA